MTREADTRDVVERATDLLEGAGGWGQREDEITMLGEFGVKRDLSRLAALADDSQAIVVPLFLSDGGCFAYS